MPRGLREAVSRSTAPRNVQGRGQPCQTRRFTAPASAHPCLLRRQIQLRKAGNLGQNWEASRLLRGFQNFGCLPASGRCCAPILRIIYRDCQQVLVQLIMRLKKLATIFMAVLAGALLLHTLPFHAMGDFDSDWLLARPRQSACRETRMPCTCK